jgi:PhnB protein
MKEATTYLTFDGNCREAVEFYGKCFGAEVQLMKFSDAPGDMGKKAPDRIMHARVGTGTKTLLMASDTQPGTPFEPGRNFSICVDCETREELDKLFQAVKEKGEVTLSPQDMFWGAYFGMLKDQFGVHWMFNFAKPQ